MKKLISGFLDSLNLAKTKIHKFPSKIFLCGGPNSCPEDGCWASARHFVTDYLQRQRPDLADEIVLAEIHADWRSGTHYKTLMDVELDIASLAKIIVIFLESPGAIAELGAFAMIREFREKIHIFIQRDHFDKRSFINDGLIAYTDTAIPQNRIYSYEWSIEGNKLKDYVTIEERVDDIVCDISDALAKTRGEFEFDGAHSGHQILFLGQMIYMFGALLINECYGIMCRLFLLSKNDVLCRLYALERIGIIKKEPYGKSHYYIPKAESLPCLLYSKKTGSPIDSMMYMIEFREKIKSIDERRFSVISKYAPR